MVKVKGQLKSVTGTPLTSPLSITLTDYGVLTPSTLYLPAKIEVLPNSLGAFEVELWANQDSSHPCYYRVETPQGSSFLISVPGGVLGPLDIGDLVVTKLDLKEDTNILHRLAKLEAGGGSGGGVGELLTLGEGLVGGTYNGSSPVTASIAPAVARLNSPTFVSPSSNHPSPGDNSNRLATTGWSSDAGNLTAGTIPSSRLPSNLAATTAQRLATPRSILGVPFDGTADGPSLSLGVGLIAPTSTSINLDFGVVASQGDARFTNSREWLAATVTQSEAQAGTDTSRKAWSVQRVWQAIGAWWLTVEAGLARLASPNFTGAPTVPTPSALDSSTKIANTSWASNASNLSQGTVPIARIPSLNQDTTGNSGTATKLLNPRSILGASFDGSADLPLSVGNGLVVDTNVIGIDPGDSRMTNAREWVASTVTLTEAEGGTDTSRKAWTSQRVRQAILAWWATLDTTLARLASPVFTGTPTAPSPSSGDSSTRLATTEWASNASNLTLGSIPAARVPTLNQNTTGNAATATKLATARTIAISGATAASVAFDGTANIGLVVTAVDATLLTGTIAAARIPTLNQNTTGTASNVTGVVALSNGGNGSASPWLLEPRTNSAIINGNSLVFNQHSASKFIDTNASHTNLPLTSGGTLTQVDALFGTGLASQYRTQEFVVSNRFWKRSELGGVWGTWQELATLESTQTFSGVKTFSAGTRITGAPSGLASNYGSVGVALFTSGNGSYVSLSSPTGAAGSRNLDMEFIDGAFQIRRLNDGYNTVTSYPLKIDTNDNVVLKGFSTLGDNVALKCKRLTGTTASTQDGAVSIAHGLNGDKIQSFTCKVIQGTGAAVPPNYTRDAGYDFQCYHDPSNIVVRNSASGSIYILSKPIVIIVWYIA